MSAEEEKDGERRSGYADLVADVRVLARDVRHLTETINNAQDRWERHLTDEASRRGELAVKVEALWQEVYATETGLAHKVAANTAGRHRLRGSLAIVYGALAGVAARLIYTGLTGGGHG